MPLTQISNLSDDAKVWVFGINPAPADGAAILRRVDAFLADWAAHQVPVLSSREIRDGRFLVIAAEKNAETSGCSIDRLFGLVRDLEREFGVSMLDPGRVFFRRGDGSIADATRVEFGETATPETIVFDTTVETLGEVRSGAWERRARDSWHAALLRRSA